MSNTISDLKKLSVHEKEIEKDILDRDIVKSFGYDTSFPEALQKEWEEVGKKMGDSLYFDKGNVIIESKKGYVFSSLPELLFACYIYDFYSYLFVYYNAIKGILEKHPEISSSDYNKIATQAKKDKIGPLVDVIKSSDYSDDDKEKLLEFATNYKAWNGGKTIDRVNDFYVSPIYAVLNIVQSKSGIHSFFPYLKDKQLYRNTYQEINRILDAYQKHITSDITTSNDVSGKNIIYYGAPGTGKSYSVSNLIKEKYSDYNAGDDNNDNVFRVTLHPEYTYSDFVGQLLPHSDDSGKVDYRFIPGIFTNALKQAIQNPDKHVYLVLEEMSRANVAAVFGDLFQLLDRKNGSSEYAINNDQIAKIVYGDSTHKVTIPGNMTLFGTVNTSDQNVFVMDTAFKRRFDWRYVSTNAGADTEAFKSENNPEINIGDGVTVNWKKLYQTLNQFIVGNLGLSEDKQIGPYFIKFEGASSEGAHRLVRDKLLQYLWEDINSSAMEMYTSNDNLFEGKDKIPSFSSLYEKFDRKEKIFSNIFIKLLGVNNEKASIEN